MSPTTTPTTPSPSPSPPASQRTPTQHTHTHTHTHIHTHIHDLTLAALLAFIVSSTQPIPRHHQPAMPSCALPAGLVATIFTALVLALAWTVLVWFVHAPPSGWAVFRWRWRWGSAGPGRYVRLKSAGDGESAVSGEEHAEVGGGACTSALEESVVRDGGRAGGQLVRRRRDMCASPPSSTSVSTEIACGGRDATSPWNPFLEPLRREIKAPRVRRSSEDWVAQHRLFFAIDAASRTEDDVEHEALGSVGCELEALEAQTTMLSPVVEGGRQRKMGWMDRGLEMFDGAVDGLVVRIVEWADDDGGDDALLLPLARVD